MTKNLDSLTAFRIYQLNFVDIIRGGRDRELQRRELLVILK